MCSLAGKENYTILKIRQNYLSDHLTQIRKKNGLERNAPIKLLKKRVHRRQKLVRGKEFSREKHLPEIRTPDTLLN